MEMVWAYICLKIEVINAEYQYVAHKYPYFHFQNTFKLHLAKR